MSTDLPMCCRACRHKQSEYQFPLAWTHRCLRLKPMIDDCRWRAPHTEPIVGALHHAPRHR